MSERAPRTTCLRRALVSLGLIFLTFAAFQPTLDNGFVDYDDPEYVTGNQHVAAGLTAAGAAWALTTTNAPYWHPVTWLAHMLDVTLFGLDPAGHHATSMLLHAATAVTLYLLLGRLTGRPWLSLVIAALFAVHPLRVESVAWVSEKKDVLAGLFWVLSLGAYVRYCRRPGVGRYALLLILFLLGLGAKPMAVSLPLVLLLIDWWPLGRLALHGGRGPGHGRSGAVKLVLEKLPLLLLAAAASALTLQGQREAGALKESDLIPLTVRLLNAAYSAAAYLGKALWPARLSPIYPHPGPDLSLFAAFLAIAVLLVTTIVVIRRRREQPWLLFGWVWYAVTLAPAAGLVQVGWQGMADRYTYLPLIGPALAVAATAVVVAGPRRRCLVPAACTLVAVLAFLARHQAIYWRDSVALFSRAAATTKDNVLAEYFLGDTLRRERRPEEAERHLLAALDLNSRIPALHYSLGLIALDRGDVDAAVRRFERAVQLAPGAVSARIRLGEALERQGRPERALEEYLAATALDPTSAQAHLGAAALLSRFGREKEAARHTDEAGEAAHFRRGAGHPPGNGR